jgi:hypothetical protein
MQLLYQRLHRDILHHLQMEGFVHSGKIGLRQAMTARKANPLSLDLIYFNISALMPGLH